MIYTAFGLTLSSDIALPPLTPTNATQIDVTIQQDHVNKKGLTNPVSTRLRSQAAPDSLWFHVPNIAWFHVSKGNTIHYEPEEQADEQSVRLYLLGTCMGAVMHQRNRLVIHGNAVRIGDECVIFAGLSGNGKSTLAAAFHKKGYELLADDLAVINEQGFVQPSYPQIKLWHDTAERLNIDVTQLQQIRLQVKKYAYPLTQGFCDTPLPVRAMYILNTHKLETFEFQAITGMNKFLPLKNQTYRKTYIEGLGLTTQHLKQCAQLANTISMIRITRPTSGFDIDQLVERIEADLNRAEAAA